MSKSTEYDIEVLAPGRNYSSAKQAIKCGADSIYIAADAFGLRYGFGNDIREIEKTVKFAHKYWAKVYVTVNTLIFEEKDFDEVKILIDKLYKIGADALIIQDMGLLELDLPPIPLFASTTTSCFTPERINFLSSVGVRRAILPRELTLSQIKNISSKTDMPLETFVHGLICVGYSGKCYLQYSKTIKNTQKSLNLHHYQHFASSNGKCDMNCMHTYSLADADGNIIVDKDRLLNMHFLNLSEHLEELIDAGVSSFKIEGRHKEISYIKNITALFRQKADEVIKKKNLKRLSSGRSILNFTPDLNKTFNKGYTNFFLYGRKKEMYSNNELVGNFVGRAKTVGEKSFKLDSDIILNKGDKLRYKDDSVKSFEIIKVRNGEYFTSEPIGFADNTEIFRYLDVKSVREIEKAKVFRVLSVKAKLYCKNDFAYLSGVDEDGNAAEVKIKYQSEYLSSTDAENILKTLTGAEFIIDKLLIESSFRNLSQKDLKKLQSKFFAALRKERKLNRPTLTAKIIKNNIPYPEKKLSYLDNVVNKKAEEFYKRHGVQEIEPGTESGVNLEGKQILTGKYCIKNELNLCSKLSECVKVKEPLYLIDSNGNSYELRFDCQKCEMKAIF